MKLALVTPESGAEAEHLPARVGRAVAAGADLVQVRIRGMESGALVRLTRAIRETARAAARGRLQRAPVAR